MATTTTVLTPSVVLTSLSRRRHLRLPSASSSSSLFRNQYSLFRRHRVRVTKARLDDSTDPRLRDLYGAVFGGQGLVEEEDDDDDDEDDEDETEESSIDLLVRFLGSLFRNVARRARKTSRSILPAAIPPQLVSFAVDGVLLLASLSFAKAILEVVCTLGGSVFVVILILRGIWAIVSYFQSNGSNWNNGGGSFGTTQSTR